MCELDPEPEKRCSSCEGSLLCISLSPTLTTLVGTCMRLCASDEALLWAMPLPTMARNEEEQRKNIDMYFCSNPHVLPHFLTLLVIAEEGSLKAASFLTCEDGHVFKGCVMARWGTPTLVDLLEQNKNTQVSFNEWMGPLIKANLPLCHHFGWHLLRARCWWLLALGLGSGTYEWRVVKHQTCRPSYTLWLKITSWHHQSLLHLCCINNSKVCQCCKLNKWQDMTMKGVWSNKQQKWFATRVIRETHLKAALGCEWEMQRLLQISMHEWKIPSKLH